MWTKTENFTKHLRYVQKIREKGEGNGVNREARGARRAVSDAIEKSSKDYGRGLKVKESVYWSL